MNILFKSHANCTLRLVIGNDVLLIPPLGTHSFYADTNSLDFTVSPDEESRFVYLSKKGGVILKRFFTVSSAYSISSAQSGAIDLFLHSKKGRFADQYNRVAVKSASLNISDPVYSVADSDKVRAEFDRAEKKGKRALFLFDLLDILGNALTALLLLLIPFALIWIFGSFETAYTVCGYIFIPVFAIIVIINRVADKYKKKLWRLLKGRALRNSVFKGNSSYLSHEYISFVFSQQ